MRTLQDITHHLSNTIGAGNHGYAIGTNYILVVISPSNIYEHPNDNYDEEHALHRCRTFRTVALTSIKDTSRIMNTRLISDFDPHEKSKGSIRTRLNDYHILDTCPRFFSRNITQIYDMLAYLYQRDHCLPRTGLTIYDSSGRQWIKCVISPRGDARQVIYEKGTDIIEEVSSYNKKGMLEGYVMERNNDEITEYWMKDGVKYGMCTTKRDGHYRWTRYSDKGKIIEGKVIENDRIVADILSINGQRFCDYISYHDTGYPQCITKILDNDSNAKEVTKIYTDDGTMEELSYFGDTYSISYKFDNNKVCMYSDTRGIINHGNPKNNKVMKEIYHNGNIVTQSVLNDDGWTTATYWFYDKTEKCEDKKPLDNTKSIFWDNYGSVMGVYRHKDGEEEIIGYYPNGSRRSAYHKDKNDEYGIYFKYDHDGNQMCVLHVIGSLVSKIVTASDYITKLIAENDNINSIDIDKLDDPVHEWIKFL